MNRALTGKWKLKGSGATIDWEGNRFGVDVSRPERGIEFRCPHSSKEEFLFATPQVVVLKNEQFDPFCRGGDLLVAYPCSEDRPIGAELSWRSRIGWINEVASEEAEEDDTEDRQDQEDEELSFSIELLYSIHTDLLDSKPNPQVNSRLRGEAIEFFEWGPDERLRSCSANGELVACMVQRKNQFVLATLMPSDLRSFRVATEDVADGMKEFNIIWDLELDFLEKGVIRRMRSFSAIGKDSAQLVNLANQFFRSDVPLTA